jgi:phosphonate transport system substrate-binding protein
MRIRRNTSWGTAIMGVALLVFAVGCGDDPASTAGAPNGTAAAFSGTLHVGAIPDQDPDKLLRTYEQVSEYLETALPGVEVEYRPVTDYGASVAGFRTGDLDLVWFGGLSGVQARSEVPGALVLAQRDIDAAFRSVFIADPNAGVEPIEDVEGLSVIAGRSLTFGSESSTSGRVMPQYFLAQAGVDVRNDLAGQVGYSGAHDKTIELVAAGTFEVGAVNSQVWDTKVSEGAVDPAKVVEIFRTPPYFDYHWVAQPDLNERFGEGFVAALTDALLDLDGDTAEEQAILELFSAGKFIPTTSANYDSIEDVARQIGVIR